MIPLFQKNIPDLLQVENSIKRFFPISFQFIFAYKDDCHQQLSMEQVIAILGENDDGSIKVEVMEETAENLDLYKEEFVNDFRIEMDTEDSANGSQTISLPSIAPDEILKRPTTIIEDGKSSEFDLEVVTLSDSNEMSLQQPSSGIATMLSALDWLASITESINSSMHYGFSTTPQPLVFHVPQVFFNFLLDRICGDSSSHKKRLPNLTESFVRTEYPPLGRYTRYTWHLTNIFHLKKVFDTPTVSLEISRKFTKQANSFQFVESKEFATEVDFPLKSTSRKVMVKPTAAEYKTFLKVGQMSTDPRDVTPFTIEWVPDLYPKTHVGELKIKFQFGLQLNGQVNSKM